MEDCLEEKEPEVEVSSNVLKEAEGIAEHTFVGTSPQHSSKFGGSIQNLSPQRMSQKIEHITTESAHGSIGGGDGEEPPHGISVNSHDA
jgi:hypothetical protein